MENRAHALAAGLFIIGLLIAAALTGNWIAGKPPDRVTYRVTAKHPVTVNGLNRQSIVRFRGLQVGTVKDIDVDGANTSVMNIDIEIDKRIGDILTEGTYAELSPDGITGLSYVQLLDKGTKKTPLQAGALIEMNAGQIEQFFESAKRIATGAEELVASVQKVLTDQNRQNFADALASVKTLAANLEATSRRLPGTLDRVDQVMSQQNRRNLAETLAQLNAAVAKFPELAGDARVTLDKVQKLTDTMNKLALELNLATGDIRGETLPRAHALAESVERGAERVGKLAYELEKRPQSVLWGRPPLKPGPGEVGFE